MNRRLPTTSPAPTPGSRRAMGLAPSLIREIFDAAQLVPGALRLEVGEPDFPTPPWVVEAAHRAAGSGATHYTPNTGIGVLREALAAKVTERNGYAASADEVMVTAGGVQALNLALTALLDPGDEVLLPDPVWPNFFMIAHLIGARVRTYGLSVERAHLPDPAELESLVTERTRALVLNLPSNPTGACATPGQLAELVAFAERHGLWLVADECYDELRFDGSVVSAMAVAPYERTLSVYTFSKTYAMTGWRVGYAVAPRPTLELMARMQEPSVSCVNAPAQYAALAALEGPQQVVADMRDAYARRAAAALDVLGPAGLAVQPPEGAFYLWVDVSRAGCEARELALALLAAERVAVAPGSAFGPAGRHHVRISLASAEDDLVEGCRRLVRFLADR